MRAAWWARSAGYSAAGSNPRRNEVAPPRRHRRGRGGAPGEQRPAGAPVLYAPDGRDWLSRADGTRPRHLSFLASGRKPWSADNPGSIPGSHRKLGMPARRPNAPCHERSRTMWTNTPPENRCCCSGCSGCSCCGWLSARCPDCCSRTRRAAHGDKSTGGPTGVPAGTCDDMPGRAELPAAAEFYGRR